MNRRENDKVYLFKYVVIAIASIIFLRCSPLMAASYQKVSLSPADINKSIGDELVLSLIYDVSDNNNKLSGVGIRLHYDSSKLEYLGNNLNVTSGLVGSPMETEEDPKKTDMDPNTDRMIVIAWAAFQNSWWPDQPLPLNLVDFTFKIRSGISSGDSSINLGFTSVSSGYYGLPENATVHITNLPMVNWTEETLTKNEDDGSFEITANLSYSSPEDILIPFTVTGTAEAGKDYETIENSITILSGQLSASKTITLITDKYVENDKTIVLTMGTPASGAVLGSKNVLTTTIQNDDDGHFSTAIVSTPSSVLFYGDNFTISEELATKGDEIGVFDPDGVLCGRFIIGDEDGVYVVTVYGDDPSTSSVDEGAEANEELTFKVWDYSSETEITVSGSMFVPEDLFNGAIPASPNSPPKWTANNDRWGLNIQVTSEQEIEIILREGWNLFSFPINKVFYDSAQQPNVDFLTNAEFVQVGSLDDALSSISGKYALIRNFDINGAQTFDPLVPSFFNTLHYLAAGYGYWIKMNETSILVLSGNRASASDQLQLRSGWNLIGCWHSNAQYDSATPPTVDFPTGVELVNVTSLKNVVTTIDGSYSIIRNFDRNGAGTFDPLVPSFFNTLHYMGPGYGYWIKLNEPKVLNY